MLPHFLTLISITTLYLSHSWVKPQVLLIYYQHSSHKAPLFNLFFFQWLKTSISRPHQGSYLPSIVLLHFIQSFIPSLLSWQPAVKWTKLISYPQPTFSFLYCICLTTFEEEYFNQTASMKGQGVFVKLLILELSFDKQVKVEEGFFSSGPAFAEIWEKGRGGFMWRIGCGVCLDLILRLTVSGSKKCSVVPLLDKNGPWAKSQVYISFLKWWRKVNRVFKTFKW